MGVLPTTWMAYLAGAIGSKVFASVWHRLIAALSNDIEIRLCSVRLTAVVDRPA